jgi:hypothetical protein
MIKVDIRDNGILQKIFNDRDLVSIEEIIEKLEDYYIESEEE